MAQQQYRYRGSKHNRDEQNEWGISPVRTDRSGSNTNREAQRPPVRCAPGCKCPARATSYGCSNTLKFVDRSTRHRCARRLATVLSTRANLPADLNKLRIETRIMVGGKWPWPHQAHLPSYHVPELRQLVQACFPQEVTDTGKNSRIMFQLVELLPRVTSRGFRGWSVPYCRPR
jgi:hypothetical protein